MSEPKAMEFYHPNGLVPAWNQATQFAQGGKIATLPDIIETRLNTKPGDVPWEKYFTTNTAEYVGYSKGGNKIIIVAHGVGPMSTLKGILKAYSYEYNDKDRNHKGGRISQEDFLNLESGKYGEVEIVDFSKAIEGIKYPFIETFNEESALFNDLLAARLGKNYINYILLHSKYTSDWIRWHQKDDHKKVSNPYIITMGSASNCSYCHRPIEPGLAFAHLLAIGSLTNTHHEFGQSLISDIDCHGWSDGTRFVGIQKNAKLTNICSGPNAHDLLEKHWQELMVPIINPDPSIGLKRIIYFNNQWFTEYSKKGNCLDSWEPEYLVSSLKPIGKPIIFTARIEGYEGLFKYEIKELKKLAHSNSNVYSFISRPQIIRKNDGAKLHTIKVQFYRAKIDFSRRLIHSSQLCNDFETMMKLITN